MKTADKGRSAMPQRSPRSSRPAVKEPHPLLVAATGHAKSGAYEEAIAELEALVELKGDSEVATGMLASIYAELNATDRAIECFERVLALNPGNVLARMHLGQVLMSCQRPRDALAAWKPCLRMEGDFLAHYNSGLALMKLDEITEARRMFEKAALNMPPAYELQPQLQQMLRLLGD